jgi:hypothetical protein
MPNPKLKLLDQVREVLRLKHYSIRTQRCYCDWIRRYIKFHHMHLREELSPGEPKIVTHWTMRRVFIGSPGARGGGNR